VERIRKYWPAGLIGLLVLGCIVLRLGPFLAYCLAQDRRKKARRLWGRAVRLLRLAGLRRPAGLGEGEWAGEVDRLLLKAAAKKTAGPDVREAEDVRAAVSDGEGEKYGKAVLSGGNGKSAEALSDTEGPWVYRLYQGQAMARFAPDFSAEDLAGMKALWPRFTALYRRAVPAGRRILSWVLPLALPRSKAFGPF
jgi:hypothetical protein